MSNVIQSSDEAIRLNEKEEWHRKLQAIPTIRDFELNEWEKWANSCINNENES